MIIELHTPIDGIMESSLMPSMIVNQQKMYEVVQKAEIDAKRIVIVCGLHIIRGSETRTMLIDWKDRDELIELQPGDNRRVIVRESILDGVLHSRNGPAHVVMINDGKEINTSSSYWMNGDHLRL